VITEQKFNMADGRHLENGYDIYTVADGPIWTKLAGTCRMACR